SDVTNLGVDWTVESVVLIALGAMPTDEYQLSVVGVHRLGHQLSLDLRIDAVGSGGLSDQTQTSPYQLVRVPKADWDSQIDAQNVTPSAQDRSPRDQGHLRTVGGGLQTAQPTWGALKASYR